MRHVAIYYTKHKRADGSHYFLERLGSDGVVWLDNRLSRANMERRARELAKSRWQIDGFRIARGQRLDRLHYLNAAVQPL